MTVIDGKALALKVEEIQKEYIESLNYSPHLVVILVGDDPASAVYVRNKHRACERIGMESTVHTLPESTTEADLLKLIDELNRNPYVDGILVQSPLPPQINANLVYYSIFPNKDVDCFHPQNVGELCLGNPIVKSCTPAGVIALLKEYDIEITGKKAVVVGRSNIVGKPLGLLLLAENATVTYCHSKTQHLDQVCSEADILIAAIGKPRFIKENFVKKGAVVMDVGVNRVDNPSKKAGYELCGDVDYETVKDKAGFITPVPGGVGPMTIAMLLENTLALADQRRKDLNMQ